VLLPTYEYKCGGCSHRFEEFMAISDDSLKKCPVCFSLAERLMSAGGGLLFKGKGFYETDYRKPDYKAREAAEKQS
jgi:putative FmdB family regulatory protein